MLGPEKIYKNHKKVNKQKNSNQLTTKIYCKYNKGLHKYLIQKLGTRTHSFHPNIWGNNSRWCVSDQPGLQGKTESYLVKKPNKCLKVQQFLNNRPGFMSSYDAFLYYSEAPAR